MKHITRMPHHASWWVRFEKVDENGERVMEEQQSFSDKQYDSMQKSLGAAIIWRDKKYIQLHRNKKVSHLYKKPKKTSNTETGVPGVYLRIRDGKYFSFVTNWMQGEKPNRHQKEKSFSFGNIRSEQEAFHLACNTRKEKVKEHYEDMPVTEGKA